MAAGMVEITNPQNRRRSDCDPRPASPAAISRIQSFQKIASTPASADRFGFGYGPRGGIGFSYESGGYCDSWGCPDDFWDYPVAYCPVYYDGDWYRGPFYYRYFGGTYYYWIHGDWRRDDWRDRRPDDACVDRFGPPLGYDFYIGHGFIWRDEWRYRWFHRHHHDHDHDGDHDHDCRETNGQHDHLP